MNIETIIVYSDYKQIEKIKEEIKTPVIFTFIDILSKKGKKDGWVVKSHWGAKLDPFVLIKIDGVPIKAFYSEDKKDPISETIKYLNLCEF